MIKVSQWQSDDETNFCTQCNDAFTFVRRRHHCRACGRLFCSDCSALNLLIPKDRIVGPPAEDCTVPQRCCSACARHLQPLQADMRQLLSKANAENLFERESPERYLNLPVAFSMETEIKKAAYTLYNFTNDNAIEGKDRIPRELLLGAKGIAFLTIGKLGFLLTGRLGTGLVIARLADGTWSAPSAIGVSGLGWGFQVGGELTDVLLVLTTTGAVEAFSSSAQVAVGTELAVSLGPVGRSAGTDLHAGDQGASAAFSYAHSKGLFLGVSMEASIIACRADINRDFYGQDVKPAVLLSGSFPRPKAAEPLYTALSEVLSDVEPTGATATATATASDAHRYADRFTESSLGGLDAPPRSCAAAASSASASSGPGGNSQACLRPAEKELVEERELQQLTKKPDNFWEQDLNPYTDEPVEEEEDLESLTSISSNYEEIRF